MDFQTLQKVVEELSSLVIGARVDRLYQGSGEELYLVLHRRRNNVILLVSADRSMPRLHLTSAKPHAGRSQIGFVQYLKSRITGAVILAIGLLNQDRVVEMRFKKTGSEYRLVIELTGSSSNLILTDASYAILSVHHPIAFGENVSRPLLQGLQYVVPSNRPYSAVSKEMELDADEATAVPADGADRVFNRAAEAFYERLIGQRRAAALRSRLTSAVRKALSKIERRIVSLSEDLCSAERADEYRHAGGLILAHLGQLTTGIKIADLADYDGNVITVQLDPQRSPVQNAERYFKKYKKAKAGREVIATRLGQSRKEASYLKSVSIDIEHAQDDDALVRIHAELVARNYIMQSKNKAGTDKTEPKAESFRQVLYLGWEILVGKSALGNDYITMKLARPDDLWLHAEGMPGSHVLIRNPGRADIPQDVFMKAAALAAYHSKGRKSAKVPVAYARARFVKKPRGAKPGLVILLQRKVVTAMPEEI
jgi:predicted ribosome quality control (RQC) complex YloA/Tae2 family protein